MKTFKQILQVLAISGAAFALPLLLWAQTPAPNNPPDTLKKDSLGKDSLLLDTLRKDTLAIIQPQPIPMPPPPNSNVAYTASIRVLPDTVMLAFFVGVGATLAAALLPARRVSRTPIVDALRYNI